MRKYKCQNRKQEGNFANNFEDVGV